MSRVAGEVTGKHVAEVNLHEVVRGSDPIVTHVANEITREAMDQRIGGPLYVEALSVQLAVHLLREYASCVCKDPADSPRLSQSELARLEEFIDAHLHDSITLEDMAGVLGMGVWTLNRRLRKTLDRSGYALVVENRIERAKQLLRNGDLALKEIAACCGFSDQAHMTRMFRARLGRYSRPIPKKHLTDTNRFRMARPERAARGVLGALCAYSATGRGQCAAPASEPGPARSGPGTC